MIGYVGLFTLICAAMTSSLGAGLGFTATLVNAEQHVGKISATLRITSALALLFAFVSMVILAYGFALNDFSLSYIVHNSNSQLPLPFKIAATWGGHEGSMLFWVVTLSLWGWGLSRSLSCQSDRYLIHATWIMQVFVAIFAWFTLLASNPFEFSQILPLEGRDLNPMLQDIGLIIHPPLLYVGYVGFASVLALAVGSLLANDMTVKWVIIAKKCTLIAWIFLSVGIAVGSWWAYYELGWGGWWFWDPVENASLLPWLTATALVHTLLASKAKKQLLVWSYSLAFVTFCLSILGTFIVRSGVLTSVHAFAVDPSKGFTLLAILTLVFVLSFLTLIQRIDGIESQPLKGVLNKVFLLLVCANLFTLATIIVVFGTFYPMVYEFAGLGNISVGAPYFNLLIAPLAIVALFVVGFSALLKWDVVVPSSLVRISLLLGAVTLGVSVTLVSYYVTINQDIGADWSWWALWTSWGATWLIGCHGVGLYRVCLNPQSTSKMVRRCVYISLAHIGLAVTAFGAAMNSDYSYEMTRKLGPESQVEFGDYHLRYVNTELYVANSFSAERAIIEIQTLDSITDSSANTWLATPEKRHYPIRVMNMTEPSMTAFWNGDIYISLGDKVDASHYAVRIQFKAFVRWIWLGALMMVLGALGALLSHRTGQVTAASPVSKSRPESSCKYVSSNMKVDDVT